MENIYIPNITPCGENCDKCKKYQKTCRGCRDTDRKCEEWAESGICEIYECAKKHNAVFCGVCDSFPCDGLQEKMFWKKNAVDELSKIKEKFIK